LGLPIGILKLGSRDSGVAGNCRQPTGPGSDPCTGRGCPRRVIAVVPGALFGRFSQSVFRRAIVTGGSSATLPRCSAAFGAYRERVSSARYVRPPRFFKLMRMPAESRGTSMALHIFWVLAVGSTGQSARPAGNDCLAGSLYGVTSGEVFVFRQAAESGGLPLVPTASHPGSPPFRTSGKATASASITPFTAAAAAKASHFASPRTPTRAANSALRLFHCDVLMVTAIGAESIILEIS
jgi:hypothetical protein